MTSFPGNTESRGFTDFQGVGNKNLNVKMNSMKPDHVLEQNFILFLSSLSHFKMHVMVCWELLRHCAGLDLPQALLVPGLS
jgi:hypothetical protein